MSALNMYNRKFLPALEKAKIRKIRFHDLRHTYASIQIDIGTNAKYIQSQLGHASIRITMDTYGHLMKDVNQEAATRLGGAIFNPTGHKTVTEIKNGLSN
jgi:integrase